MIENTPVDLWAGGFAAALARCRADAADGATENWKFRDEGCIASGPGEEIKVWIGRLWGRSDYGIYAVKYIDQRPRADGRPRWPVTHHAFWDENGGISWRRAPDGNPEVPPLVVFPHHIFQALNLAFK